VGVHDLFGEPDGWLRLVRVVVWDVLWMGVLRQLGRAVLLIVTWGRFPRGRSSERHGNLLACVGLLALAAAWSAIALWNHWHEPPLPVARPPATSPHSPPPRHAP
jgi:hypothetical protein